MSSASAPSYPGSAGEPVWKAGDVYHNSFLIRPNEEPVEATINADKNDIPTIAVSAAQGKYLKLLVQSLGAKRVIELGTLGGYSTIWMAQALPADGKITTLELSPKHASVAGATFEKVGVKDKIEIKIGPALDTLLAMKGEGEDGSYDFAFIDADNEGMVGYYKEVKRLLRKGGVAVIDNVNRHGRVSNHELQNKDVQGIRDLLAVIKEDTEVEATTMGLAGAKGYDAYMYIVKQ